MRKPLLDFNAEFLALSKQLLSFLFRLTCNKQDAEDILHDTFLAVSKNSDKYEHKSSFKTWVYAIAINLAKNKKRVQKKWALDIQDKGEQAHLESPALMQQLIQKYNSKPNTDFEIKEHINYCFNCITKTLDLNQQICLWLREFYGFTVKEIELITGLTNGSVKHNLIYSKNHMSSVFEKRCAFVNKNGVCHQCSALKGILNLGQEKMAKISQSKFKKQASKNKSLLKIRINMIKDLDPLSSPNSHLHTYMLEKIPDWAKLVKQKK